MIRTLKLEVHGMAYRDKIYRLGYRKDCIDYIEHEISYAGVYGRKGEKRLPRKKKTPFEMQIQNVWNKMKRIRRTLRANFSEYDLWVTLTLDEEHRGKYLFTDVKQYFQKTFLGNLRKEYRKLGEQCRYMYLIEMGEKGGIHIHMVLNRSRGKPPDLILAKKWKWGHVYISPMYQEGGFEKLANYLANMPEEKQKKREKTTNRNTQMECFGSSRNLERPQPERKVYKRRTVRKLLLDGPTPEPGYYIDKESIKTGINKFTGYAYFYYTEVRLKQRE